ncbi:MAG: hypothetical protein WCX66_03625, partial [archaeon]
NFDTFSEAKQSFFKNVFLMDSDGYFVAVNRFIAEHVFDSYFSQYTVGEYGTSDFYAFSFSFDNKDSKKVSELLDTSIKRAGNGFEFITINDCSESACPKGTITLNYPLSNLTNSEFDSLPKIISTDLMSGDATSGPQKIVGSIPVFENKDLKIEIPLRFLKAIYEARKYAINLKNLTEQGQLDCSSVFDLIDDVTPIDDSLFEKVNQFNNCETSSTMLNIDLVFRESNPMYVVSPDDQDKTFTENYYKVRITKYYPLS